MAKKRKPGYCNCKPGKGACKKRQKGKSGDRCRRECDFADK